MSKDNIMNNYSRKNVTFVKGVGSRLYDENAKEYLDFVAGVAVNCLGHSSPVIIDAIVKQSKELIHVSNLYWNNTQIELAKKLTDNSDFDKVFFCNSGTEAIEAALKIARKKGNKQKMNKNEIIYMANSFHGRTLGALSVTGQEKYQKDYMPLMKGTVSTPFNDKENLISQVNENTCGIIIEPIQGEGGVICADKEFLLLARELCNKFSALLIFDEVQCGIGRTGSLFAYQDYGVIPDIICLAKGLGGGFPIGAVMTNNEASNVFEPGDHGSTFGGNPLACAVSISILNELIDNNLIKKLDIKSKYLYSKLSTLVDKHDDIISISGKGLLLGLKVKVEPAKVVDLCFEKGLLVVGAGKDVIRVVPALNIPEKDIDDFINILDEVFTTNKEN